MNDENCAIPDGYSLHRIDAVKVESDAIIITYSGRIFGGIIPELLPPGIAEHIRAGAEIIVRTHSAETGWPNQVAHLLMRHPTEDGWAELYENM